MKSKRVFVRPTKGRPVPGAPGSGRSVPVEGCEVAWGPWWADREREGDLERVEPQQGGSTDPKASLTKKTTAATEG